MAEVVVTIAKVALFQPLAKAVSPQDPTGFPCRASVAALWIYLLLRMCEEVLKALIVGRRSAAMKNQASAKKLEEEVVQKKEPLPPALIWVSGQGECYHVDASCQGLRAAAFVIHKRPCLVCAKKVCVTPPNIVASRWRPGGRRPDIGSR